MIRLTTTNLDGVSPDRLPPRQQESGPARMLFLSATFLGFKNYHQALIDYAAPRNDIDSVHIELATPLWMKVLGKSMPFQTFGWDFHPYRHLMMWRGVIRRWLRGPLHLDHFDVVHIITQGNSLAICDFNPGHRVLFATNIDGTAFNEAEEFGKHRRAIMPFARAEQRIFDACDLLVCRNRWCSDSARRDYHVPDEKIIICRNSLFVPEADRGPRSAEQQGRQPRIVFVGNHFSRKGGPRVVAAHQRLWADKAELHICSKQAPADADLKNVISHGSVPRDTLINELLPTMDIFVMPTTHDMHPWAILEAASVGLPVVTTRMAGIPEMVLHEQTGLLHEPHDWPGFERAVTTLLDDPAKRTEYGTAARKHIAADYNPDDQFGGLLDRLVRDVRTRQGSPPAPQLTSTASALPCHES